MSLQFATPRLEDREAYLGYLAQCPQCASDYSFANIFGWAEEYGLEWAFAENRVWIRQTRPELVYWAPVGSWRDLQWRDCALVKQGATMIRVPEQLMLLLQERLGDLARVEQARGHWDYIYSIPDLISLSGNRFHRKKNLLHQFKKNYDYSYQDIDMDCIEETLEMQQEWYQWRECEDSCALLAENSAVARILHNWDRIPGLVGGALHVDNRIVAYTIAERLVNKTLVVHFEKGKSEFKGVYQAINQMFLEAQGGEYHYVNREQDLDDRVCVRLNFHIIQWNF